jgi:predicted DNA-binding protein with PD1-like motif
MRSLVQPGPVSAVRIESFRGHCECREIVLEPGLTLAEAISQPLVAAGVRAATLRLENVGIEPLRYVMPGPADGPAHVAYFSAPRASMGRGWIELASVTFGCVDAMPRLHCHAAWVEADGAYRGGHILLDESIVAVRATVAAWTFADLGICAETDPETNFSLLRPVRLRAAAGGHAVLARIRPNQDLCTAVEAIAREYGMRDAVVRGSLGSLIGARFVDGTEVTDHATEVLVRDGQVRDGVASIDMSVVDMQGRVHSGRLVRGDNPVCITFDLVLEDVAGASPVRVGRG